MASWQNIGYHNYRDQDWKKKFMHHEKATGKNLWGHGSWLHQQGYLTPKSDYADRKHGNVKSKYDDRWKWNPDKNLSMQDKWGLYGRVSGHGKANEGYVRFNLGDIDHSNVGNVNWERQFRNRGWWDHVSEGWKAGQDKVAKWDQYRQFDTYGIPKDVSTHIQDVIKELDFGKSNAPAMSQLTPGSDEWNDLVNQATQSNFETLGEKFGAAIPDTSGFASPEDVRAAIQSGGFQTAEDVRAAVAEGSITPEDAQAIFNEGITARTSDFIKTGDFERVMEQNVGALERLISGEGFGTNIGGLDLEAMQQALSESETGIHELTKQFSGLEGGLAALETAQGTQAEEFQNTFSDIAGSLEDLGAIDAATALDISDLQAQDLQTSEALGDIRDNMQTQAETWEQNLGDLDTHFQTQLGLQDQSFTDALGDLSNQTAADILDTKDALQSNLDAGLDAAEVARGGIVKDFETQIGELDEDWAQQFQQGRDELLGTIDTTTTQFNNRLSKLSASMDYRLLGDSAEGVRFRKSKAALTGNLFKGTEQLGRNMQNMKIKALNL